ncbi:MAG: ABC transporter ATP-binding protein [Acidobacteria bacterium]|nr:ABC transporter ATP-binding protein [Acidobacteriota bacterium]
MAIFPVTCRGVVVRFGATRALDGLDLEIPGGRITALVGPNGAGKTTTLRLLAGLVPASRGEARVLGLNPWAQPVAVRRRLGLLPDRPVLPAHLSVLELVRLRAALYGLTRTELPPIVTAALTELAVDDLSQAWCGALSHGQAQRVALAAVLAPGPEVLLVDEPMTALDLEAQVAVRASLRRRADDGATVVVTTHTIGHVAALADHVVRLAAGRVLGEREGTRDVSELEEWMLASSS